MQGKNILLGFFTLVILGLSGYGIYYLITTFGLTMASVIVGVLAIIAFIQLCDLIGRSEREGLRRLVKKPRK